ncbi:MAG: TRAP transporter large permease [Betaproteobacteria bacterium]
MIEIVLVGVVVLIGLFFAGVPIFVALGLGTILIFELTNNSAMLSNLGTASFEGVNGFAFLAVPLFILTGDIISRTGIARALLQLAGAIIGHIRGGITATVLLACGIFAAISGSSASDAAVFAKLSIPELEKRGYPRDYSAALVAAGGTTAVLIPPSIGFILISYTLQLSLTDLFLAAFVPGVFTLVLLIAINFVYVRWGPLRSLALDEQKFSFRQLRSSLDEAKVGLCFPVIILGGIYSGIFTPTEAGAVAVAVGLLHGALTRRLTFGEYCDALLSSGIVVGVVMPIVAVAYFFGQALTVFEAQAALVKFVLGATTNPVSVLLLMFVILFILGTFMDLVPNILVLGPLLLPIAVGIGMDPLHFGIWFMFTLAIGLITPPYGINLFVVCGISGCGLIDVSKRIAPFLLSMILASAIIAAVPRLSLFLIR